MVEALWARDWGFVKLLLLFSPALAANLSIIKVWVEGFLLDVMYKIGFTTVTLHSSSFGKQILPRYVTWIIDSANFSVTICSGPASSCSWLFILFRRINSSTTKSISCLLFPTFSIAIWLRPLCAQNGSPLTDNKLFLVRERCVETDYALLEKEVTDSADSARTLQQLPW